MDVLEQLDEARKAFHEMDWEKLAEITKKIADEKPEEQIENLASGFHYYALSKLEKEQKKVILDLEKAGEFFRLVDPYLAAMADVEKLILLSEFDEKNRGQHLLELGELTQGLFIRTGDLTNLQLAIDSFSNAKSLFSGRDLEQILLGLQFCYGSYAQHSENPEEHYREVIKLCEEMKTDDKTTIACSKMNVAIAHQSLASLDRENVKSPTDSINKAIESSEEAIGIFEQLNLKPETTKAKKGLGNVLRDASTLDTANAEKYMDRAITLKKEVAETLLEDGIDIESAYEALDIGITYIEFAACDQDSSDEHLENAIKHFDTAGEIFEKEGIQEGHGHAKAGIAAVYRNQGLLEKAAKMYEEAVEMFEGEDTAFLGPAKQNLAATYRDVAEATGKKEYLKKAEKLEKEAAELSFTP